ncbi:citrate synthase [Abditibacterium utsteinense]|uniref:Citrate synthase n=1 Tax=Abditibacterium utsteinense TaxID=1960156 RepID=A0A2S8SP50_9BACT|nr:citrate synthase [Abditibacterium utsteinense]PQV62559.1 citrate synthase [Abditibacterium utsteinense]
MSDKKPSGLEDVVVAQSSICFIDGKRGQLVYRGYDIDDLAANASFEEVAWLLWNGKLPTQDEFDGLKADLSAAMHFPKHLIDLLKDLPFDASPMRVLSVATAALGILDPDADDMSPAANRKKAINLTAQLPIITCAWHHIRNGTLMPSPKPDKSLAYNFLWLLNAVEPDDYAVETFDAALILHADHELNASTFSARVTAATLSDLHSAVTSAIGTLKGPLHGGANEAVMQMLQEIGEVENVPHYMDNLRAEKKKVMGFGHRVYKAKDPRAVILEKMSEELGKRANDTKWFEMTRAVEAIFQPQVLAKGIFPNVDFYSASAYQVMGIPRDLFTPIFACSRVVGWTAHLFEQYANNRLFRPSSDYVGEKGLKYAPISQR